MGDQQACSVKTFTASDGCRWKYRHYPAVGPARATLVCVHGIQSHGGWYTYSSGRLARAGYEVFFLERRGAGLNTDQRQGDAPHMHRLVLDVVEFLRFVATVAPRPLYLLGISWGGKLASTVWRWHPWTHDGLVLMCPGLINKRDQNANLVVLGRLVLYLGLAPWVRRFALPLNEPELFTASPRWQKFIAEDPLMVRRATARLAYANGLLNFNLTHANHFVPIPVLLMLAEHDDIIDNEKTREHMRFYALGDLQINEYANTRHTLEFGDDPDQFIDDLIDWVERQREAYPESIKRIPSQLSRSSTRFSR